LIKILKNEFPKIKVIYKEREKFMPERGTLKNDKAKKLLNFEAKNSIEEGYIKYISWYKKFWENLR
jgi:nucleoside-diphosphate-sugar epimerase